MRIQRLLVLVGCVFALVPSTFAAHSIARIWDDEILAAIRIDLPHPPVHARNLFHLSIAMYDAWAAYTNGPVGYLYRGKHTASDIAAARREAISYAAYRILVERYVLSRGASNTMVTLSARMAALGYSTNNVSLDTSTPAGVGNTVAATVSAYFINDGAQQTRAYQDLPADQGGYVPVNPPLLTQASGTLAVDVNRWQPLAFTNAVAQNGIPDALTQKFLGAQWKAVRSCALERIDPTLPWIDVGPPPRLGTSSTAEFRSNVVDVLRRSNELTPDDGVIIDISPGVFGNNSLGTNDGTGHPVNPATGLPYAPNRVKRGDFSRVLAEFWADGPSSETPPGHWNTLANVVADSPSFVKRIGGTGPVLDDLEWDVKVYFALNAAVHDAACAAWSLKRHYDGWRPIEAIRYMAQYGQSSNPTNSSYDTNGLPLVPGLIEVVTQASRQPGQRHAGLPIGAVAVFTWPGPPADALAQYSGVKWILGWDWLPFQKRTFVTPAFPGYISGHSTFSRAAAEVLTAITGSAFFPGGLSTYTALSNSFLTVERGPSQTVQLQWATYYDAADQAGLSRIWGGIHPPADDLAGRTVGSQCGKQAWSLTQKYFDGSITNVPIALAIRRLNSGACEIRHNTLRGLFYKLQSTPDLNQPFADDGGGFTRAVDSSSARTNNLAGARFYRVISSLTP